MDACRTIIAAVLACALLQMSERLSFDAQGWRLATAPTSDGRA